MEYTIDNLDELYSTKERAKLMEGIAKSDYDKAIHRLTVERNEKIAEFEKDIKAIETLIEMVVGDQDEIVTQAGKFTRKTFDPSKKTSYVVNVKTNEETIKAFEKSDSLAAAIKKETKETKTILKDPVKELLAAGILKTSSDGHLIDDTGEILDIEAYIKPVEIKFKANK